MRLRIDSRFIVERSARGGPDAFTDSRLRPELNWYPERGLARIVASKV